MNISRLSLIMENLKKVSVYLPGKSLPITMGLAWKLPIYGFFILLKGQKLPHKNIATSTTLPSHHSVQISQDYSCPSLQFELFYPLFSLIGVCVFHFPSHLSPSSQFRHLACFYQFVIDASEDRISSHHQRAFSPNKHQHQRRGIKNEITLFNTNYRSFLTQISR